MGLSFLHPAKMLMHKINIRYFIKLLITVCGLAKVAILPLNLIRSTHFKFTKTVIRSTEPPLLPNRCYLLGFFRSTVGHVKFALFLCVGLVALLDFLALVGALQKIQMCHQMGWLHFSNNFFLLELVDT
jgi:hypothetical protein